MNNSVLQCRRLRFNDDVELRIKTIHSSLLIEGNRLDEKAVTAIFDCKRVAVDRKSVV